MKVVLVGIALLLIGCPGYLTRQDQLPAISFYDLPADSDSLRQLADRVHKKSRKITDLIRAHSALRKSEQIAPKQFETLWRLARVDCALSRWDDKRGNEWALAGQNAAKQARALEPQRVEGHLYYAICSGLLAQHNTSKAQALSKEVLSSATAAVRIDPNFQRGFARQVLGAVYLYAPEWPAGVGDLDEAIEILEKLVKDYPNVPLNVFYLAEAYRKGEQREDAVQLYQRVLKFKPRNTWRLEGRSFRKRARASLHVLKR